MKISIRWALIIGCLALIWGTQIIIASSTYLSSQKVLIQHAHDIMQNIADLTMEQSQNHLALAQGAAHLTKRLMTSRVVGSDWNTNNVLERYFLDLKENRNGRFPTNFFEEGKPVLTGQHHIKDNDIDMVLANHLQCTVAIVGD